MDIREAQRFQAARQELVERMSTSLTQDGIWEAESGLQFIRRSHPSERIHGCSQPSLCVMAQGSKEVYLGADTFRYDPAHYLITTMELPISSQVVEASPASPYLGLVMRLDPTLVASVIVESGQLPGGAQGVKALDVSPLDVDLLEALLRLVRLTRRPEEYRVLSPLIQREILFRLLVGEQGGRLRHLATLGGPSQRMVQAVERLRRDYQKPLRIEHLARELGMSTSGFHAHFKAVTSMSPLQFQKLLRLQEARRLMLGDHLDAAEAGYRVGYEDPSHFSRDYKKHFGNPPARDVEGLRELVRA